ncbi:hypothetical protein MP638_006118 [Amoeboaphelidium occidentale]|nr:hypothetical protein MP638_006118 [Amoeboaphelidium occidentale]
MNSSNLILGLGGVGFLAGFIGSIVHGSLSNVETPVLVNQFIGVWFSALFAFFAAETVYLYKKPLFLSMVQKWYILDHIYYNSIMITALICFISLCVVGSSSGAGIGWSLLTFIYGVLAVYLLLQRRTSALDGGDKINLAPSGRKYWTLVGANSCFQCVHWCFAILLTVGAITAASITQYPAPGVVRMAKFTDGRSAPVHTYCLGEKNSTKPVIWLTATAAHGVVDFYGMQYFLSQKGYRVCSVDFLGFGWSGDVLQGAASNLQLYADSIFDEAGEGYPMVLVGNGGAGSFILDYYKRNPSKVSALVLLQVYTEGIEFEQMARQKNLQIGSAEFNATVRMDLQGRISLGNIILGLGVPWGLMPVLVPPASVEKNYYPPEKKMEYRAQLWTSKMWVAQRWALETMLSVGYNPSRSTLATSTVTAPLIHVLCNQTETQICQISDNTDKVKADACLDKRTAFKDSLEKQVNMTLNINPNATIIQNTNDYCSLSMFVNDSSTAASLISDGLKIALPNL